MKKSVLLMAGLMAMALAGSAQAATMFAVQGGAPVVDKFTVDETGVVNATGIPLVAGGPIAAGLTAVPPQGGVAGVGTTITAPAGVFHVASEGSSIASSSFLVQHAARLDTGVYPSASASNFSFYRVNKSDAGVYSLPANNAALGFFNFGTIDLSQDPNTMASKKNIAQFSVKAQGTWASITDTPTYFTWSNAETGGNITEKMRLSAQGNLGINMPAATPRPTSKLQVVGLPVCIDNANAKVAVASGGCGLTVGAFYLVGPSVGFNGGTALPLVTPTNGALQVVY